ncbi:hypothetical protein PIB30_042278 [Stylosanthes scabra]|uniref:Uncharacterized protein n=1 Tax=Stylosanthes scabra TaxID=79078 RepID=A0ABU6UDT6_9FABA|nr:hypothetical protein [Stylosanthes scabra]
MGQGALQSKWTWQPLMSESLILSLLDPNDDVRQFGKSVLEQVSNTRGLSCGVKFLCSHELSLGIFTSLKREVQLRGRTGILRNSNQSVLKKQPSYPFSLYIVKSINTAMIRA